VIAETALVVDNFEARLPDNFYAVREAWMCTVINGFPYQTANSFYSQASTQTTIQVSPITTDCAIESPCCGNVGCDGSCMPEFMQTVYKTNNETAMTYQRQYLLKPGNISARGHCDVNYTENWEMYGQGAVPIHNFTPGSSTYDSFDIRDNKFVTNFRNGVVHLVFYAQDYDSLGNQLIPDNYRIREYLEHFIKYKVFEMLVNQTNDETFNQLQQKLVYYKGLSDEAFIMADIEIKKQDVWTKQRRIRQQLNKFAMYELPNRTNRWGYRRNN
jgi:hypothetical protein